MRKSLFLAAWMICFGEAGQPLNAHSPAEDMADAARRFLAALTPEQRAKATFAFVTGERFKWHYVPGPRKGIPLKELTPAQRPLAFALLASALSHRGFVKATTIMSLEEVLRELEASRGSTRDPELYYLAIFGHPGPRAPWGWRVEGHHLSLNFALAGGEVIAVTPSFLGANPAEVQAGPRQGLRVLSSEEDLARALVRSLNAGQRKIALIATNAPREIITGVARTARPLTPEGLPVVQMNATQSAMLMTLVKEYVQRHRPEVADKDLEKIQQSGWDHVHFAWAGGIERGEGHYYRVQGPTFLMEYDNTQNHANHIHTVWRDFANDWGEDTLSRHYATTPHAP